MRQKYLKMSLRNSCFVKIITFSLDFLSLSFQKTSINDLILISFICFQHFNDQKDNFLKCPLNINFLYFLPFDFQFASCTSVSFYFICFEVDKCFNFKCLN
jgi:hypothetical protein